MSRKFERSNKAHLRSIKFFREKPFAVHDDRHIGYHREIVDLQRKQKRVLPKVERKRIYKKHFKVSGCSC